MKNYVQSGSVITVTADRDIKSGELVLAGALVGYAQADALEGENAALVTEGVFRDAVAATAAVAVGDVIYLDAEGALTTDDDDGANARAGIATLGGPAVDGSAEIHIKLNA